HVWRRVGNEWKLYRMIYNTDVEPRTEVSVEPAREKCWESVRSPRLFPRPREDEPVSETPAPAGGSKSPREALNEQWLRIRAGLGGSSAIDSMHAVYRSELRDLRSAEQQACALVDEIFVTLLNGPLAERVSQYVAALRRRTAEHERLLEAGEEARSHRNPVMRAFVHEASRVAETCTTNVR